MKLSIVHKLSLASILLVLISTGVVGSLFYTKTTNLLVEQAAEEITGTINNVGSRLQANIASQSEDTLFLASLTPIQGMLRAMKYNGYDIKGRSTYDQWKDQLQSTFKTLLENKFGYLKIRFIDKFGQERVVVNKKNDQIIILDEKQLQNKARRPYVKKTFNLARGSVYLSEFNLNQEHGKVSIPHQQVLRSATPVFYGDTNELAGMVIVTADTEQIFQTIQNIVQNDTSNIYITNDHGGYLLHPNKNKAYGFDLGKRYRIQEEFPQLATLYLPENNNTHITILPNEKSNEHVISFIKIPFDPENPKRYLAVGVTELYDNILMKQQNVLKDVLSRASFMAFILTLIAVVFAIRLSRPIKQITQVMDDYTHQRQTTALMPVDHNDEIGVLARSYNSLIQQVEEAQQNLKEMNANLESMVAERTKALESSEYFQRSIIENMADGLITSDEQGVITSYNPAAASIFQYDAKEIIGKNINILVPDSQNINHKEILKNYKIDNKKETYVNRREVEGKRKDGSTFPMGLSTSQVVLSDRKIFLGVVRDITERKQMEKMKNEFVSTVSHELRTPLTAIRGSLGLVNSGAMGEFPEKAKELLIIAANNTERLLLLINDILDMQKIESGQMVFNFKNISLMPLIEQAIEENAAFGEQYGVTFVIDRPLEDAQLFADKDRLMQVFSNLFSNAAKYSTKGSKVSIHVSRHNKSIRIAVTDHGTGIPEEFQPRLFEKFTQSDSSTTRKVGGTGLGLSIVKVIVETHGGKIDFISREGIGTTFTVDFPEIGSDQKSEDNLPLTLDDSNQKVIIAEHNPDTAALLQRILTEAGIDCDLVSSADQLRLKLNEKQDLYKAIIVETESLRNRQVNIGLFDELNRAADIHDIPVILVSAHADESKQSLIGTAISVTNHTQKPMNSTQLVATLKEVIETGKRPKVLHVEDEADAHKVVKTLLEEQCKLLWATNLKNAKDMLVADKFDLVLLDVGLPDGSGLDLLEIIEQNEHKPNVVIYSAFDINQEYAQKVSAVLVKSKTDNVKLIEVINKAMKRS